MAGLAAIDRHQLRRASAAIANVAASGAFTATFSGLHLSDWM
jgi:hypothetical protein